MPSVFLSSTYLEMRAFRQEAVAAITESGYACINMEAFPASDRSIPDFCRTKIEACDLFVLLLGRYYGTTIPGNDISFTEDEFDWAVKLRKPRLVFTLAPDARPDVQAAIDAMESAEVNPVERKKRQAEFCRKAIEGILPRPFTDPADLKFRLARSIMERFGPSFISKAGENYVRFCDRSRLLDEFADIFETGEAGAPEVYVLHGHEQEQHSHCVQRMVCLNITYPRKGSSQTLLAPPEDRALIDWPPRSPDDSEDILFSRLCRKLFQALTPEVVLPRENRVEAFCQLAAVAQTPYLRFRHTFRREDWSAAHQTLCARYLRFWSEVAACFRSWPAERKRPRLLLFFEFMHRSAGASAGQEFHQTLQSVFRDQAPAGFRTRILTELSPVPWADLDIWYQRFESRLLPQYQNRIVTELFSEAPLPMAKVERRLGTLLGLEGYAD